MPDSRETIIRIDHAEKYVEVWSIERSIINKLDKAKVPETDTQRGGVWRRVPIEAFRWRILKKTGKRQATAAQLENLAKARAAQEKPHA